MKYFVHTIGLKYEQYESNIEECNHNNGRDTSKMI